MSKQEIIGEINMNHKQKGGLEAEKIAAISVSAGVVVVLLFCFIYYIYKSAKISPKNIKCTTLTEATGRNNKTLYIRKCILMH